MRTESRAGHYREDFPERDDKNWLRWIIVSQKGGKIELRSETLPMDRYKFRATRFYSDNLLSQIMLSLTKSISANEGIELWIDVISSVVYSG